MNKTDRLHHITKLLRARRRITLAELQAETGASRATLMRDLAWLRDGLNHPIHWDRDAQCYQWRVSDRAEDAPEEVAGLWFRPSEVLALLTLDQLLRDIQPGDLMQRHLQPIEQRLKKILHRAGLDGTAERQLGERIRVIGLGQRPVPPQSFETVGLALSQRRRLAIHYQARGSGELSERTVSPQRLVYYRSNWLLDAWCHKRDELRSFSLDAISHPVVLSEAATDIAAQELDETLGNGYGIFSGKEVQWATLRFTPERARWVAPERWHPEQKGQWDEQGHWVLQIPYSDDRELVMDILRHTPEVEVIAPADLRQRVLEKMQQGLARMGASRSSFSETEGGNNETMKARKHPIAHAPQVLGQLPHDLDDHLRAVSALARRFAQNFGPDWAELAGLWHDLGKYRAGFQRYLALSHNPDGHIEGRVVGREKTHSAAGALWAIQQLNQPKGLPLGHVLAYLIAGHHAGLDDWHGGLNERLKSPDCQEELESALAEVPAEHHSILHPTLPAAPRIPGGEAGFALWVRMLFSCLVDADFLDTEAYFDAGKPARRSGFPSLAQMLSALDSHMAAKAASAASSPVNVLRADILRQCRVKAALEEPGFFSLTVPTGGGKTLSSLAFALEHAKVHGHRRIVYAIPYTSIIEQTAEVFRGVFAELGDEVLIEHHSQADAPSGSSETARSRLACENWDAPLVVTTNVQLFESLFAAKTSRCRKLHNLVGSVIVLDEAQQLPPAYLNPILGALKLLVKHYGVTVVLCTATQPALTQTDCFDPARNVNGLDKVVEIIDDPDHLYRQLDRVQVELPADWHTPTPWTSVAQRVAQEDCVLTIVNTRKAARELYRLLPEGTLHLSALMCGAHRKAVIDTIKSRLRAKREGTDKQPLRVVSTQLVEAGVDLDFPVVYRALAGLDSIAQAAGRCNREGLMPDKGRVVVFVPPERPPAGHMRKAADACISVLNGLAGNPLDRGLFTRYFQQFYHSVNLDEKGIAALLKIDARQTLGVQFRSAADAFKLIDDSNQATVVVRYAPHREALDKWLAQLQASGPERWLMRKLQRYTVTIPQRLADTMLTQGSLTLPMPGLYVQVDADNLYDSQLGLKLEDDVYNPSGFVP